MVAVAADGSVLLDSTLDPLIAAVAASQPKFAAHRTAQQQQTIVPGLIPFKLKVF